LAKWAFIGAFEKRTVPHYTHVRRSGVLQDVAVGAFAPSPAYEHSVTETAVT
jgi:hypothetical protein